MRRFFLSAMLGLSLGLTACNDTKGSTQIIDVDPPRDPGPVFQFGSPASFGLLPGEALGLAVSNFDGDALSDAATFVDTDPEALLLGGTIFVQQGGLDPTVSLRLDITGGPALSRLKTLMSTPEGDLLGVASGLVGDGVGALRFLAPLATGAAIPVGNNRQSMPPFALDIPDNATLATCTVAGQPSFAVPGLWEGSGSGVLFLNPITLNPIGGEAGFLSTTNEAIVLPRAVCAADFNHDGRDDLVVVGNANAVLYLQSDNGTFLASDTISPDSAVRDVCSGQLDSDAEGRPDLAIITEADILVYLNGDFTAPFDRRLIGVGQEIRCGDLNDDGFVDLFGLVGLVGNERVFVTLGQGTGAFARLRDSDVGDDASTRLSNVRAGQFTDDGLLDLVLLKTTDTQSEIILIPQL